MIKMYFFI